MKRIGYLIVVGAVLLLIGMPCSFAQDQSDDLAQYARQQKKHKDGAPAAAKVFDNDNLPKNEHVNVVGTESPTSSDTAANAAPSSDAADPAANSGDKKPAATEPGQSQDDRQQANGDWQTKIKQQKEALDLAQRELDVLKREYAIRAATVASDVGYRLRNASQWDKEDKQYKEQIAAKQKVVDDGKQKLNELQEDARKAGVPTKMRE